VLLDTIYGLLCQLAPAKQIIVVDQTHIYSNEVQSELVLLACRGHIILIELPKPSIPKAMNTGLLSATEDIVLFLDDDIEPARNLTQQHFANYHNPDIVAVVGKVTQSGRENNHSFGIHENRSGIWKDLNFNFDGDSGCEVSNCMAGNMSVRRRSALQAGGFDENFTGVAYRFETEFCRRLQRHGGLVVFDPSASLIHLQSSSGGTRSYGNPFRSASPAHSVGDYYFAFRESNGLERVGYIFYRMFRSIRTRYHLLHPWWIPVKLTGEMRGLAQAFKLSRHSPRYVGSTEDG
jgi:GT2 family glycosyltransferase